MQVGAGERLSWGERASRLLCTSLLGTEIFPRGEPEGLTISQTREAL